MWGEMGVGVLELAPDSCVPRPPPWGVRSLHSSSRLSVSLTESGLLLTCLRIYSIRRRIDSVWARVVATTENIFLLCLQIPAPLGKDHTHRFVEV